MIGSILGNFGLAVALSLVVLLGTAVAAVITAARVRSARQSTLRPTTRVTAVGCALLVLAATASPYSWPPVRYGLGDLVLEIGGADLGDIGQALASPTSLAAVLLLANIGLYIPLTFSAALGWPTRTGSLLLGALLLSVAVESVQFLILERVAATDDVILNMVGATVGLLAGVGVRRRIDLRPAAIATGD